MTGIDAANRLLILIDDPSCEANSLAGALDDLACQVRDHLGVEDAIIANSPGIKSDPWISTWQEGQASVMRLRKDWLAFLDAWSAERIASDRLRFAVVAANILGRLRERVQIETHTFYATALQTGMIGLR